MERSVALVTADMSGLLRMAGPAVLPTDGRGAAAHVAGGCHARDLLAILRPEINLAIWRRSPPPALARLVATLAPDLQSDVEGEVRLDRVEADVRRLLIGKPERPGAGDALLIRDIAGLVRIYCALTRAAGVAMRLERIVDNACCKFHADQVGLRLLTTYLGPGTQWLPDDAVRRRRGLCFPLRHAPPQRLERFAVGLFKGESYPGNCGRGIVHRSPPVSGTGKVRILLCLDELRSLS